MTTSMNASQRLDVAIDAMTKADKTFRPHQVKGVKWMLNLEQQNMAGILADDPGLGKTYQALSLIASDPAGSQTLIIVPTSIIGQWQEAATELLGEGAVRVHHGPRQRGDIPRCLCVISSYGVVRTEDAIREKSWHRVIMDEAHCTKNRASKISKATKELNARFRWSLTGTPVQNKKKEIENLFSWVRGDGPDDNRQLDVSTWIERNLLRRRKEVVLTDLPEIDIETTAVPFRNKEEEEFYIQVKRNVKREFKQLEDQCLTASEENVIMFELLLRLRQACQHPQLVFNGFVRKYVKAKNFVVARRLQDETKWRNHLSSKHAYLFNEMESHPTESSLVFCQFTEEIRILEKQCLNRGIECRCFDGSVAVSTRNSILRECKESTTPIVLLIQIRAGGVGLNLQTFSRVYILSPDWNPCNEIQAMARSHRMGQLRNVVVKRLVLQFDKDDLDDKAKEQCTIDDDIIAIQNTKRGLMATLLKEESLRSNGRDTRKRSGLTKTDYKRCLT